MSFRATVLSGVATGTSAPVDCSRCPWLTVYLKGSNDAISAGVVTIEEADFTAEDTPPTSWAAIGTINATDGANNAQKALHIAAGAYSLVRARISTNVAGGTVTITIVGNGSE